MALWWFANAMLFAVVIPAVVVVAQRLVRRAQAAKRSVDDIVTHSGGLIAGAEGLGVLDGTRQRVRALRGSVAELADVMGKPPAPWLPAPARPPWVVTGPRDRRPGDWA